MTTRFPLSWPTGWKRTPAASRKRAKFSKGSTHYRDSGSYRTSSALTVPQGFDRLQRELERAFFMKQMANKAPIPDGLTVREFPT